MHCSVLFVFTSEINCPYSIFIEFVFFSVLDSFKVLNFLLHISVKECTIMTKYGLLFYEACWMPVDCNTQQYTQLNSIDYSCGVFDPCGVFAVVLGLLLCWLCHCSGFCIRHCGISQLGFLWCILCLCGWHCEYGDADVTDLSCTGLWTRFYTVFVVLVALWW